MSRIRFRKCLACGDYHWTNAWPANHVEPLPLRSSLPSPYFISDSPGMDLQHPIDNSWHDSKSEFRKVTKQHGAIELGNDHLGVKPELDPVIDADVGEAIRMVKNGYVPQTPDADKSEMASIV